MNGDDTTGIIRAIARGTHFVVTTKDGPALRAQITRLDLSMSTGGMTIDEDFELVEREAGEFVRFECHGDSRVRRYFQQRGIIDAETLVPREHSWVIRHEKGGKEGHFEFGGRLYGHYDEVINANKAFRIMGRIRLSPKSAAWRGHHAKGGAARVSPPPARGHAPAPKDPNPVAPPGATPHPEAANATQVRAGPPPVRLEEFDPMVGFYPESYFVVEAPDGDTLYILITDSYVGNRSKRDPRLTSSDPANIVGIHFHFKCVGNHRAQSYLFDRSVLRDDGKPAEHEWVIEYSGSDGVPRQCKFAATLHDYRERPRSNSEWAFLGVLTMPFLGDA